MQFLTLDARLKVSSFTKARHLAKGSVGFLLSFLEILQPTYIYLMSDYTFILPSH